jgi:hypothetical protein
MNAAPNIVTREIVFILGWKIWGISATSYFRYFDFCDIDSFPQDWNIGDGITCRKGH